MNHNPNIIFIDTETGGLEPLRHSILTLAAVAVREDAIVARANWAFRLPLYSVDAKAMQINGLNLLDVWEQGVQTNVVASALTAFASPFNVTTEGGKIIRPRCGGHNVGFDRAFIDANLPGGSSRIFHHENVDTKTIGSFLADAGVIEQGSMSLGGLYERVTGKRLEEAHNAVADVEATAELYLALKRLVQK